LKRETRIIFSVSEEEKRKFTDAARRYVRKGCNSSLSEFIRVAAHAHADKILKRVRDDD
jgi:uncharacterized protein (DUF1778 family)